MTPQDKSDWEEKPKNDKNKHSPRDWRDLSATPQRLAKLFQNNSLPESAWHPAQKIAGNVPTSNDWLRFADMLFAGLGTIFLLAGIVFFFAFNWDDLSKWNRFAIVEGGVIISTCLAFFLNLDKWAGRLALGASTILLGVALAVISQEYQTGADSYRLFQVWLMLITGWVLISRWNIMYLIWMVLLNITLGFYWEQIINTDWETFNIILLIINAGFVFLWEIVARFTNFKFMKDGRWFLYIFMAVALSHGTGMMSDFIFSSSFFGQATILAPIVYLGLFGFILLFYIILSHDLLMLTFGGFSVLVVGVMGSGKILWEMMGNSSNDGIVYFFLMGIITVGLTTALVTGLRSLQKNWEATNV